MQLLVTKNLQNVYWYNACKTQTHKLILWYSVCEWCTKCKYTTTFQAPKSLLTGSFWDLIQYLTDDDIWDDLVRVRAIYRWITSYDIQNMDIDITPPSDTPLEYFSKMQCDMGNLANLFYILCTYVINVPNTIGHELI
jgi:hypothetical protein